MIRVTWYVVLLLFVGTVQNATAARYWISPTASNWNNSSNWSTTSGGTGGASIPGTGDDVFFDGNGVGNCNLDVSISIRSLTLAVSFSGIINEGSNPLTTSMAATFFGGTFAGNTGNITIGGAFTLNGTNFTSTSGVLELNNGVAAFTTNSFFHNNGSVRFNGSGTQTLSGISPVFNSLEIVGKGNTIALTSTGNITVLNNLNTSGTLFYNLTTGVIDVKGNINSTNTASGCGGDALINIVGTTPQFFSGSTIAGAGALPQIVINTTGGLTLSNYPAASNNFTYISGAVTATGSTLCFTHGTVGAYTVTAALPLNNLSFIVNTSLLTITLSGTIPSVNDLLIAGAGNLVLNTGTVNVNGNIALTNSAINGGGTATINISGSTNQSLDGSLLLVNQSRLPALSINKTGGTLSVLGNISASANITYLTGTVNAGTSTFYVVNNLTVTGNMNFYNLTITATTNLTLTLAGGTTASVNNIFDMENTSNYIVINGGTIAVQGNIIDNNTNLTGGGNATILINGTANQAITTTSVLDQGRFPGISINKPSGTLTLPTLMTVKGDWTYTSGTLDISTNNSTVVFENTMTITGTHTLNNIIFNGVSNYTFNTASATTLTVAGNISMLGTGNITLNAGAIHLNGDLTLANTGGGGGTTILSFTGTTNQTINSSVLINQNCLPSVTINKSSGTLIFPTLLTVRGNWVYTSGTLDVTTNNSTVVFADPLGTGLFGITGSHTLNNVSFEATNNNTLTVATGTILIVTGTYSTLGTANMYINTPVTGATAVFAKGNISIGNSGAAGGGTGLILINGTGNQLLSSSVAAGRGWMPFVSIQKTSGTLSLSGVISESRNWTYNSGTVDATTNLTTVVFGANNLSITSAGMNFYHVIYSSNTSSLTNTLYVLGNLTVNGTGILAPGANTINLSGNWTDRSTAGFTEAASTVNFNGVTLQTVTSPGGENFSNLIINNTSSGIQLINNTTVGTSLNMMLGNVDLNGSTLTLGLSAASNGTLSRTSGTIWNNGSFTRWYKNSIVPDGSVNGLFPVGTSTDYRPMYITAPGSAPSTGGTITVAYTDATTNTAVSIADPPFTIATRKDLTWLVATAGMTGGTYNMQIQGTGYGVVGSVSDLRLSLAGSVVGTTGVNGGTVANPQVNRTGLNLTNLTNSFYLGSVNMTSSPLPVTLLYFTARLMNGQVDLKWATTMEINNDFFTIQRSVDGVIWDSLSVIPGKGSASSQTFYETSDLKPTPGNCFYRLKNTDWDGHFYYSSIQLIRNGSSPVSLELFPNPAANLLNIRFSQEERCHIEIFNGGGKLLQSISLQTPTLRTTMDVSSFFSGPYYIRFQFPSHVETRSLLIRR